MTPSSSPRRGEKPDLAGEQSLLRGSSQPHEQVKGKELSRLGTRRCPRSRTGGTAAS